MSEKEDNEIKKSSKEICLGCDSIVYINERVIGIQLPYHNNCFKCTKCRKTLHNTNYYFCRALPYCKIHFFEISRVSKKNSIGFGSLFSSSTEEEFHLPVSNKTSLEVNNDIKKSPIEKNDLFIIRVDTLLERLEREKKMSLEEVKREEEEYKNESMTKIIQETCCFCESIASVKLKECQHNYCQNCFEISQSDQLCLLEDCQKKYTEVINLKNGRILKL